MRLAALLLGLLLTLPGQQQAGFPRTIQLTGELTYGDYERLFERGFAVPPGTRRVEVAYAVSGAERRTVVDLGLRGPSGFRGWSGGGKSLVWVSALGASPSYLPGPIESGEWAVLLGVPNIRAGSRDMYTLTIRLYDTDLPAATYVAKSGPGWFVGDLHSHSGHSDGKSLSLSGATIPTPPHRVFDAAANAGIDFLALSDHNTVSHWLDVDRLQPHYSTTLLLHAREVTTYRGHANVFGESSFTDFRLPAPTASPAALVAALHHTGALVSINHPNRPDDESCMGCGWNVVDPEVMRSIDAVEVVNGTTRSGPMAGWAFWVARLNEGFRLTAIGGSDKHAIDNPREETIGVPATVVYAAELSERAIVEGLRSGRAYIRTTGKGGPELDFWAEVDGRRTEMGGTLPPATLTLHAEVTNADGQRLEWIRNGAVMATETVDHRRSSHRWAGQAGDWFSLVIRDERGDPTLISNPIYVR